MFTQMEWNNILYEGNFLKKEMSSVYNFIISIPLTQI